MKESLRMACGMAWGFGESPILPMLLLMTVDILMIRSMGRGFISGEVEVITRGRFIMTRGMGMERCTG